MEENLILEGLLSMVTELKEKQEAQVTPASREETLERLDVIERTLSELRRNPAIPEKELQAVQSRLDNIRDEMQGQQKHIEDTKRIALETYRCFNVMVKTLNAYRTEREEAAPLPLYRRIYNRVASWTPGVVPLFGGVGCLCRFHSLECPFGWTYAAVAGQRYEIPLLADARTGGRGDFRRTGTQVQVAAG